MKSILINEPASPATIHITEQSDQMEQNGNILTIYLGVSTGISSQWKEDPSFSDTVFHSIEGHFVSKLSAIKGFERIFSRKDGDLFRVWIVIPDIDLALEDQIYSAQMAFMDEFADIPFDFVVIFRQGKDLSSIKPSGARQLYPSA